MVNPNKIIVFAVFIVLFAVSVEARKFSPGECDYDSDREYSDAQSCKWTEQGQYLKEGSDSVWLTESTEILTDSGIPTEVYPVYLRVGLLGSDKISDNNQLAKWNINSVWEIDEDGDRTEPFSFTKPYLTDNILICENNNPSSMGEEMKVDGLSFVMGIYDQQIFLAESNFTKKDTKIKTIGGGESGDTCFITDFFERPVSTINILGAYGGSLYLRLHIIDVTNTQATLLRPKCTRPDEDNCDTGITFDVMNHIYYENGKAKGDFSSFDVLEEGEFAREGDYNWCWPIVKVNNGVACLHLEPAYTVDFDNNYSMCEKAPKNGEWNFAWLQTGFRKEEGVCAGDDAIINPGFEYTNTENSEFFSWGCLLGERKECWIDEQSHSGDSSVILTKEQGTPSNYLLFLHIKYNGLISFWAKTKNAVGVRAEIGTNFVYIDGDSEWKHYTIQAIPNNPLYFFIFFINSGTLWIDDVQIITNGGDLGKVVEDDNENQNIAVFDGVEWSWQDATDTNNLFKIKTIDGLDVISNSNKWYQCGDLLGPLPETTPADALGILPYEITGLESTVQVVGELLGQPYPITGPLQWNLIPADEFGTGLTIEEIGQQPPGEGEPGIGEGGAIPPIPESLKLPQHVSKRFICYNHDELNEFTECCGYSLQQCYNTEPESITKVRRTGNVLTSIYEFVAGADSQNYALLFGLPFYTDVDYNLPLTITYTADNPIHDWSGYAYLEFYITSALEDFTDYLQLLVLDEIPTETLTFYLQNNNHLALLDISQYIVNQPEEQRWLHVKIPLTKISNKERIQHLAIYADYADVPDDKRVTHPQLPGNTFRNVLAIDRIFLTKETDETRYCGAFPTDETDSKMWVNNAALDSPTITDAGGLKVGQVICDSTPGWGWTGTKCCGDDVDTTEPAPYKGESFIDSKGACLRGNPLLNDSVREYTGTDDFYFLETAGTGTLYHCGDSVSYSGLEYSVDNGGISSTTQADYCGPYDANGHLGSYYCEFNKKFTRRDSIPGGVINESRYQFLAYDEASLPTTRSIANSKCCPQDWCALNSTTCVPDQSEEYGKTGAGMPWNYSKTNGGDVWGRGFGVFTEGTKVYEPKRCIRGEWQTAVLKWNPSHTEEGFCDSLDKCYLDSAKGCVDIGYYRGDDYCEAVGTTSAQWTSRTKLIALRLAKLASGDYTIYCDTYNNVLNEYDYLLPWDDTVNARKIILGDGSGISYSCPGSNLPCSNNFCVLIGGGKVIVGTSLNLPVNTKQYPTYSFLKLFDESKTSYSGTYMDYCDQAIVDGDGTNVYKGCNGPIQISPITTTGTGKVLYNNYTQSIIYSMDEITIDMNPPSTNWLTDLWEAIYTLFRGTVTEPPYEFVSEVSDISKVYISKKGTSQIRGVVEAVGANQTMVVSYTNLGYDICSSPAVTELLKTSSFYTNVCQSNSYITKDPAIISQYWNELTTRTRLQ